MPPDRLDLLFDAEHDVIHPHSNSDTDAPILPRPVQGPSLHSSRMTTAPNSTSNTDTNTSLGSSLGGSLGGGSPTARQGWLAHSTRPTAQIFLYAFRSAAVTWYILSGILFRPSYVLLVLVLVLLLAVDFWIVRNVSGRILVGLKYTSSVDSYGQTIWIFHSRPSAPTVLAPPMNPSSSSSSLQGEKEVSAWDKKSFWVALYAFPVLWCLLLLTAFVRFHWSYIPVVLIALAFQLTNALGFTYADRHARQISRNGPDSLWSAVLGGQTGSGILAGGLGGLGQLASGNSFVRSALARVFFRSSG